MHVNEQRYTESRAVMPKVIERAWHGEIEVSFSGSPKNVHIQQQTALELTVLCSYFAMLTRCSNVSSAMLRFHYIEHFSVRVEMMCCVTETNEVLVSFGDQCVGVGEPAHTACRKAPIPGDRKSEDTMNSLLECLVGAGCDNCTLHWRKRMLSIVHDHFPFCRKGECEFRETCDSDTVGFCDAIRSIMLGPSYTLTPTHAHK